MTAKIKVEYLRFDADQGIVVKQVSSETEDMHFGLVFHVRWVFSPQISESHPSRLPWDSETSGEKSISHGKPYKLHFIAYLTLQGTLIKLNTRRKVEDHEQHVRWMYLITVIYMGESQKYVVESTHTSFRTQTFFEIFLYMGRDSH